MKNLFLILTIVIVMSGCTSLVSGDRLIPIAPGDSEQVKAARNKLFAPRIVPAKDDIRPVMLCKFGFDGTLNDESRVPHDERATMVGYIHRRVTDMRYYPGVGMQDQIVDNIDLITGTSMLATAEIAREDFISCAKPFMEANPNGEIRVFVTGFSRGAATARHFMHIVGQTWNRQFANSQTSAGASLRFYAILFDTVATGQRSNPQFHLELTPNLNYLVHFVARDEPRPQYKAEVDVPLFDDLWGAYPARVNTIYLPGAHSDIGASYPMGIGDDYQQLTGYVLSMLGLISDRCFINPVDSMSVGKHDSRGRLHLIGNVAAPDSDASRQRPHYLLPQIPLSEAQAADIRASNLALTEANLFRPTQFISTENTRISFTAKRLGHNLTLTGVASELIPASARIDASADGGAEFAFKFALGSVTGAPSNIRMSTKVVERIKPDGSDVGITYTHIPDGLRLNFYVDGVWVEHLDMLSSGSVKLREMFACPAVDVSG
jgi:hypothetical protein